MATSGGSCKMIKAIKMIGKNSFLGSQPMEDVLGSCGKTSSDGRLHQVRA